MDKGLEGLLLSIAYIGVILFIAWVLRKYVKGISSQFVRKFAHISLSLWYFIFCEFFTGAEEWVIWIGPAMMVLLTAYAAFSRKMKFLSLEAKGSSSYGVLFYNISLLLLLLCYCYEPFDIKLSEELVGVGILTMGFGDGLAGLVGSLFAKAKKVPHLPSKKTWAGIITMFLVSTVVIGWVLSGDFEDIFGSEFVLYLTCGAIATLLEAFSPKGWDNLIVPIGTVLYTYAVGL